MSYRKILAAIKAKEFRPTDYSLYDLAIREFDETKRKEVYDSAAQKAQELVLELTAVVGQAQGLIANGIIANVARMATDKRQWVTARVCQMFRDELKLPSVVKMTLDGQAILSDGSKVTAAEAERLKGIDEKLAEACETGFTEDLIRETANGTLAVIWAWRKHAKW